jgi:hypothetical protein
MSCLDWFIVKGQPDLPISEATRPILESATHELKRRPILQAQIGPRKDKANDFAGDRLVSAPAPRIFFVIFASLCEFSSRARLLQEAPWPKELQADA